MNDIRNGELSKQLVKVELGQGTLKYGDIIALENYNTQGMLSTDLRDKIDYSLDLGVTSSTIYDFASFRSSFMILPTNGKAYGDDVCFGDELILQVHAELDPENKRFLRSKFKTPTSFSRKSKQQQVCLSAMKSNQCLWTIEPG